MTTEGLVEQIRGLQSQEEALRKHCGVYLPKDVDQYIEKLLERMHNMEASYQQRHEEVRTGLLGMTRERDALKQRLKETEARLADAPQQWMDILREQGQVALPIQEVEQMRADGAAAAEQIQLLTTEKEQTAQALAQMTQQAQDAVEQARLAGDQLKQHGRQLQALQTSLESAQCRCQEQDEALNQAQAQYQALAREYELARQATEQLMEEKKRLERESTQHRKRWQTQRESLVSRYQNILRSQQQCMERLQESFIASVKCMQSLGEAGLVGGPEETTEE